MIETMRVRATQSGPALALRRWTVDDVGPLLEVYRDPAIRRWVQVPIGTSEEAAAWVAAQQDGWRTGDRLSFAVHEDSHGLVGCVVLKKPNTKPEVGYWTAPQARGLGVASRAVDALSVWAFSTYELDHIELLHRVDNVASCRVAEKAGYALRETLAATPNFPLEGHLHVRPAQLS
jgi:RimJ/RimL family protein N-acetyltransferase